METSIYHPKITDKLNYFLSTGRIPNIIFHGSNGSGKRTLVKQFIDAIYNQNKELIKNHVMNINCAHGKGIKFVREELKFFAKTNVNLSTKIQFKTVVLSNADKLTTDAQSALRRCIELFCHTTRFFIVVESKYRVMKPILSRLCEIFVPEPIVDGRKVNLYQHYIQHTFPILTNVYEKTHQEKLTNILEPFLQTTDKDPIEIDVTSLSELLYEKGFSALDLIQYIENSMLCFTDPARKYNILVAIHQVKKNYRNEKLLMLFILDIVLLRSEVSLANLINM